MSAVADPGLQAPDAVGIPEPPRGARHPVAGFLARRVGAGLVTLLVLSFVVFFATNVLPGNVAEAVLGKNATPQSTATLLRELHLDHPFIVRYGDWLGGILTGHLGKSAVAVAEGGAQTSVAGMIGTPLLNSVILACITIALLVPLATLAGAAAALRAGRPADYSISLTALVLGAFPEFVIGTFAILIFFTFLHVLPPVSLLQPGQNALSDPEVLVLPVITLLAASLSFSARQVRAGMIEVLRQDFVTVPRLNGLAERRVLLRYALRNALAPSVQIFAQTIQYILGGIIVVESVFAYPGIGTFLVNSVTARDVTSVEDIAMILATACVLINILADLIVVMLVPKLRTSLP